MTKILPARRKTSHYPSVMPAPQPRGKRAEDTMTGCQILAAADLARAAAPGSRYMRGRLEHSAAMWTARAELLGRVEASAGKRMQAAAG